MKILIKDEVLLVAGGGILGNCSKYGCKYEHLGDGRNRKIACYDANEKNVRSWTARDWKGALWFCCSGDEGDYDSVIMNSRYYNCKSERTGYLGVSYVHPPSDIRNLEVYFFMY